MSRLFSSRRLFVLLLSIILLIVLAGITLGGTGRIANFPEQIIMNTESAISGLIYQPVSQVTSFFSGLSNLQQLYEQNAQLKSELQNYESIQSQLVDSKAQIQQLEKMLGYKQTVNQSMSLVPADVTGRDPSTWNSELLIDAGLNQGVKPDMSVVSPDGSLVGRVSVVSSNSAKVVLITDTQLGDGVSAFVQTSSGQQPFGIVVGSTRVAGQLQMSFWAPLIQVSDGEKVVTSGLSDIYPKGILIGTISSVQTGPQGSAQSATIIPAANLNYLQHVFVVTKTKTIGETLK